MPQPNQLPGPTSSFWEWQLKGSCRGADSSIFFHPDGERGRARAMREQRAKAICNTCPVIEACRSHALSVGEPYGIWGGMTESERDAILRPTARNRGRRLATTTRKVS
ncbi:WhiB family transcription regulator [Corynebacterium resistens DSM 45100]|uniref:Transcriptional regulator WhiB n=1 Tax=Corynebacterium resistens (strain DSM 45100 / JCM 12819 / GTC 2026 / SICGH 158) TaxID=662755 RepID=F8E1V8_CORRG|nr:WhiB family transcriptional regulator [Corynebacterium resistens]AEI10171.1 WhiB family transcription regulator [Corynebacterium resistens DSM 45100]